MQATNTTFQDYRAILTSELMKRVNANPSYSLRRFAQQLELSPATLSGVLSGKRRLSLNAAAKIGDKLNFSPLDAARFYQAVAVSLTKGGEKINAAKVPAYAQLDEDVFQVISDWYYYAILELTFVKGAKNDPRWFARKLGLNYNQTADAINRLLKIGLLEIKKGALVKTERSIASTSGTPSAAIRRRHKQILQKAVEALDAQPVEERDFTSITMAIDPALLPEASKRITAFRRELCEFLESGKRERVYELSIQFFSLSEGDKK